MFFEYPKLLWLMVVPALMVLHYLWLELAKRHPHLRVSTATPWLVKRNPFMAVLRHIPFVLRVFALAMIVVAIARPRSSEQMEKIDTEGIDIILAMDVSTSMLARDLTPDNEEDNLGSSRESVELNRIKPTEVRESAHVSRYSYRRLIFDGVALDDLTLAVYADFFYIGDIAYESADFDIYTDSAYGTLCLYTFADETLDVELTTDDVKAIESYKH